jgi:hypothetical protein
MDGLRTPLVLHNTVETYQYDQDITIPLQGKSIKVVMPFFVLTSKFGI